MRRVALTGAPSLTPSERRVGRLAGDGPPATPGGALRRAVTGALLPGVLVLALALALVPAAAHAAFPGRNGPLVIGGSSFDRDTETDVFFIDSIRPDGRPADVGRPSCSSFEDEDCPGVSDPVLSPDGRRLAFRRGDGIAVADPDGSELRELAGLPPGAGAPAWSPDGTEIVFAAAAAPGAGAGDSDSSSPQSRAVRRAG